MSRARVQEVSSPISLFPFIGILLCTMGALLVVLVAVSRSARNTAQRQVQTQQTAATTAKSDGVQKKLAEVDRYVGALGTVRGEAERKLRDEEARLRVVEDHIRRLNEKFESLRSSAVELQALDQQHFDDHQQAEREIERRKQLIVESQKEVDSLREAGKKEAHSYAVVPYEGPNGTFRRPIYIECVKNELILQPEGVHIKLEDLRPPIGPGNPLATVLRASRDHIVRNGPQHGASREAEPYPLLLVRPDGLVIYDRARQAVEAGDFDLGFELVESDWKLKFPPADPQLAGIEQQALDQARARQEMIAAAAPRAYGSAAAADAEEYGFDDDGEDGGSARGVGGGNGSGRAGAGAGPVGGGARTYVVRNSRHAGDGEGADGGEAGEPASGNSGGSASAGGNGGGGVGTGAAAGMNAEQGVGAHGGTSDGGTDSVVEGTNQPGGDGNVQGTPGASATFGAGGGGGNSGGGAGAFGGRPGDKNLVPDGYESSQSTSVVASSAAPDDSSRPDYGQDSRNQKDRMNSADKRGKDWALKQKPPRAVAVRRTIHVTVRGDQLAILPDGAPAGSASGKLIPLHGDTVESLDEFVREVRDQIDGWGMAGIGLYWRPVVVLSVAADGQRRASDMTRLLKNSGLEVRTDETAKNSPQGSPHETR